MEGMTTANVRDRGLRRLSDLTAWAGVGAVALTGVFAGVAAHAAHPATTTQSVNATAVVPSSGAGLSAALPPVASAAPSHVRSGSA